MYRDLGIVADIKKERCEWIGHVERTDLGRVVKIFESKTEGRRRMEKSRLTWLDDAEKGEGEGGKMIAEGRRQSRVDVCNQGGQGCQRATQPRSK